jgi:hypothetical protein
VNDLKEWHGKILIIDSDDDPAIGAKDRALLRETYPQAEVQTFRDAGHASSILKREETFSIIRNFLSRVVSDDECKELLKKITPQNLHGEVDTGNSVGSEAW